MTQVAQQTTTVITVAAPRRVLAKRDAKRSAAVHEAGGHIIYVGLRYSEWYRDRMSDRDQVILKLAGCAAEAVWGFSIDLDALITNELVSAHRIACAIQRLRLGHAATEADVHQSAARYLRRLWRTTTRYLSQPEVQSTLRALADEAFSNGDGSGKARLARCERWRARRLHIPDFDAVATRAAARDRKRMIDATSRALGELASEARAA